VIIDGKDRIRAMAVATPMVCHAMSNDAAALDRGRKSPDNKFHEIHSILPAKIGGLRALSYSERRTQPSFQVSSVPISIIDERMVMTLMVDNE